MIYKTIKTETWSVSELYNKVCGGMIHKPKFQRKRKWLLIPNAKDNVPSIQKYIEFLYETCHSVHVITFGQFQHELTNIDGNNRINAIMIFVNRPFDVFPEKPKRLVETMKNLIMKCVTKQEQHNDHEKACKDFETIVYNMSYDDLMKFKYKDYFIKNGYGELYNNYLKGIRDQLEDDFEHIQTEMKINNELFTDKVKITVNIFNGYSIEELAEVFGNINKYNSCLTEQEALASRLYTNSDFEIEDERLELEIKIKIREYYSSISNGESLLCYEYNDDRINAFDFMVGFQNYSHNICQIIQPSDNEGTSLYFKIFKCLFCDSNKLKLEDTLNTENINKFIEYMKHVISILNDILNKILMKNMVGNKKNIFEATHKKLFSLKKNNIYLIAIAIIGYYKKDIKVDEKDIKVEEIKKSIVKCILYHIFVGELVVNSKDSHEDKKKEQRERKEYFRNKDGISYEAGGAYIDAKAKEYYDNPEYISENITEEVMRDLLYYLVSCNVDPITKLNVKKRQKSFKVFEATLIYNYFYCNVATIHLNKNFWVEHFVPFSCKWEGSVDIHRLGNTFPILEGMNKDRSNSHISYYKDENNYPFVTHVNKLLPTKEIYDAIVEHKGKDVIMKDYVKYNEFCEGNECILIECFINKLYCSCNQPIEKKESDSSPI